jgi:hypothetical protein
MRKRIIFDLLYACIIDPNQWQNARENSTMDIEKRKKLLLEGWEWGNGARISIMFEPSPSPNTMFI